jgi:hypothetical protein
VSRLGGTDAEDFAVLAGRMWGGDPIPDPDDLAAEMKSRAAHPAGKRRGDDGLVPAVR